MILEIVLWTYVQRNTSKTCGHCGALNNVGSRDIFSCNKCNIIIDRDVNGARNIAIKRLKELGG